MKILGRVCAALTIVVAAAFLLPAQAFAQGTVLQSGPWVPGHAPMYIGSGGNSQATLFDSGPAGGAAIGYGLSEKLLQARGPGTGPDGTHDCDWSTYSSNPAGAYFICFDPNALGGGLIDYGAVGPASPQPLNLKINGQLYSLPGILGGGVPPGFINVAAPPYNACIEGSGGYAATPVDPAGSCDATAAIQAAMNTGLNLYFPPGWYHIKNQLTCNGYGQKLVGAGRLVSVLDVGSDMNMGAASEINLGGGGTQVQGACEWHDLGMQFYQNPADTLRAELINYPPAILSTASRVLIDNIRVSRGWDCLRLNGNYTVTLTGDVELGCFDQNLYMDGQLDFSFIHSVEVWPFGSANLSNLDAIWIDGTTQAAFIGRSDGLEVNNFSSFSGSIFVGNDELTSTGIDIGVLHMDGRATLTHTSGALRIGLFGGADDGASTAIPTIIENVAGNVLGQMTIGTIQYESSNSVSCPVQVHGGKLIISGGYWFNNVDHSAFCEDTTTAPSYLSLNGVFISPPTNGVSLTNPVVSQTNGALVANGLTFNVAASGHTGTMISVAADNGQTHIANNNYGGWGSPVSLGFLPLSTGGLGIGGYYDLGNDVQFPFTAAPFFSAPGDFAPTGVTCTGCVFELNGDFATFDMNLQWTNNGYTTAGGTFTVETNLPRSTSPTMSGTPFPVGFISGETFGASPQQFPLGANLNGASTFSFGVANSGANGSLANPTNFPASRAYQVVTGGRYPIRQN